MMKLFDYLFYRIYKFYVGRKNDLADTFATNLLSLMQFLTLIDVMVGVKCIYEYPFPSKFFFLPPLLLIMVLNWYRYERRIVNIERLESLWRDEAPRKKRRNGWLIVLYVASSFLFPVLYGILKHNLGVI